MKMMGIRVLYANIDISSVGVAAGTTTGDAAVFRCHIHFNICSFKQIHTRSLQFVPFKVLLQKYQWGSLVGIAYETRVFFFYIEVASNGLTNSVLTTK